MSTETENSMHTAGGGEQGSRLQKRLLAALGAAFILAAVLFLADARRPQFYMLAGKEIETALCSGTLSVEDLTEKSKRLPEIKDELDEKEMRWLELSELE